MKKNDVICSTCTGCGSCMNICPKNSIHMEYDSNGYLKPIIDKEKCIGCGKCSLICPANHKIQSKKNSKEPICYAIQANEEIRMKSSSGGFFTVLAEHVIDRGGYVYGAVWCDDFQCEIVEASNKDELIPMRLSKYVQSKTGISFKKVAKRLKEKKLVAYFGLPCQIAGLRAFLKNKGIYENNNLILIDLVCFGAPSDVYFRKYLEEEFGISNVANVKFRDKSTRGWSPFGYSIELKNGSIIKPLAENDPYQRAFHGVLTRNKICENCQYFLFPREGDFTIGDFWGIQENDSSWVKGNGTSVVLVNNEKAKTFLSDIKCSFERCEQVPLEWCMNRGNRINSETRPSHIRKNIFENYLKNGSTFREAVEGTLGGSKQMIEFSNFRKEYNEKSVKVVCDTILYDCYEQLPASNLWISVDLKYEKYINENICDGYLIAAMAFGMYYARDVRIRGKVSKRLYYNLMNYGQQILINHDPGLHKINIMVDGFLTEDDFEEKRDIVGSPCSFGVDALSTLHDRWLFEEDNDYKVNTVFSFNCGTNGSWEDVNTSKLREDRTSLWEKGFAELGLQIVHIDTNIHQYLHGKMFAYNDAMYLSRYFCILNIQSRVKKYYIPSEYSYWDIMNYGEIPFRPSERVGKMITLGWEEPIFVSLLSTEHIELVLDGAQYQRTAKTERISEWDFTYRYLNVCTPGRQLTGNLSQNCSLCPKCSYTMLCLDIMGKLELYKDVFNLQKYYSNRFITICEMIKNKNDDALLIDVINYAKEKKSDIIPTDQQVRKLYFYKWRFPDIGLYIDTIREIYKNNNGRKILWGTGMVGSHVLAALDILDLRIDAVVDSDVKKQGKNIFGYMISNYKEIMMDNDIIFVCGSNILKEISKDVGNGKKCIDIFKIIQK